MIFISGYGCHKARQNLSDEVVELVMFRMPPGSEFVEMEVHVSKSVEVCTTN
jgi:hypothetical protein